MKRKSFISIIVVLILSNVFIPLRSGAQNKYLSGQTLKIDGETYVYHDYLGKYYELSMDCNEPSYNQDADVHRFLMDNRQQHDREEDILEFSEGVQLRITANIPDGLDQKILKCFSRKEIRILQENKCNIRFYAKIGSNLKPKSFFIIKNYGTDLALSSRTLNKLVKLLKNDLTYNDRGAMAKYNFKYYYSSYFPVVIEFDSRSKCRIVNYDS